MPTGMQPGGLEARAETGLRLARAPAQHSRLPAGALAQLPSACAALAMIVGRDAELRERACQRRAPLAPKSPGVTVPVVLNASGQLGAIAGLASAVTAGELGRMPLRLLDRQTCFSKTKVMSGLGSHRSPHILAGMCACTRFRPSN